MNRKVFATLGMIFGLLIALCGILTLSGKLGGDTSYPSSAPYSYDSGYASFGADFYTYVSNNAAETASAARTTAGNLEDIAELLKNVCGIFLIGFGMMGFCFFGAIRKESTAVPVPYPAYSIPTAADSAADQDTFPEHSAL